MPKKKSKKKLRRFLLILFILLIAGGGYAWRKKQQQKKPIAIETEEVERRDITESVVATGQIHPVTRVVINPEVAGEIVDLPVREGQLVKEGDLLVKIKPDNYVASKDLAEARYNASLANLKLSEANRDKAKTDYERIKGLYQNRLISEAEYLAGKNAFDVATASYESSEHNVAQGKAALEQAEEDLAKTTIFAPMDGTIVQLRSEKGERVVGTSLMAGTEIMTVAQLDAMEARVEVGEIDVVMIKTGQKARLEVDAFRDETFNGEVTEIANASNTVQMSNAGGGMGSSSQQATKFQVKILIEEAEAFRPGMSITAYIETRSATDVLAVPLQSVTTRGDKKKEDDDEDESEKSKGKSNKKRSVQEVVFVAEGNKVKKVNVERGISDDDYVEIKEGLEEGQEVVTGNYRAINRDLKDEMTVTRSDAKDTDDES